jgi:hypothetical protein
MNPLETIVNPRTLRINCPAEPDLLDAGLSREAYAGCHKKRAGAPEPNSR